jgi:hypothetical protein
VYAPDRLIASAVLTRAESNFPKGLKDIFELLILVGTERRITNLFFLGVVMQVTSRVRIQNEVFLVGAFSSMALLRKTKVVCRIGLRYRLRKRNLSQLLLVHNLCFFVRLSWI